jgi:superfamily I DNA and/or RNA helicase
VRLIAERLTASGYPGACVGTVDTFQGQEVPVVLYSMTTSNPEDARHGCDLIG